MRVGLIGTGNMGNRFGPKILRAGHALTVYDLRREAATALCEAGAQWADGLPQLAGASEVVITSLPSPSAVEQVVLEPQSGLLTAMAPGSAYVDMSTSTPWLARQIAQASAERGIRALDAPLSNGGVFITAGGDPETFELCRPVLEAVGDHVILMGGPGMGQVAKLAHQYVSFCSFMAHAEALLIGARAGLDVAAVDQFLAASVGGSDSRERYIRSLLARDFGTPETATATLDIVSKALAVELARHVQAPASIGLAVSDILQRGQARGWGRLNHWAAVQILEQMTHTELRAPSS